MELIDKLKGIERLYEDDELRSSIIDAVNECSMGGGEKMKLSRDELMDILATVCAEEVHKYGEAMRLSTIEEFAILMLMSKVLDRIEEAIFK